jgi:hypothetical protein
VIAAVLVAVLLGSDQGQTGVKPGSDGGQTGVRRGSDGGQTGVRLGVGRASRSCECALSGFRKPRANTRAVMFKP